MTKPNWQVQIVEQNVHEQMNEIKSETDIIM